MVESHSSVPDCHIVSQEKSIKKTDLNEIRTDPHPLYEKKMKYSDQASTEERRIKKARRQPSMSQGDSLLLLYTRSRPRGEASLANSVSEQS